MRSECGAPGLRCRCGERASLSRRRLGQCSVVSERAQAQPRTGLRLGDIARLVVVWLASSVALAVSALLPRPDSRRALGLFGSDEVAGLLGLAFRPVLVRVVARIGWLAVVFAGLVGQALLVYAAIWITPGITATFWSVLVVVDRRRNRHRGGLVRSAGTDDVVHVFAAAAPVVSNPSPTRQ